MPVCVPPCPEDLNVGFIPHRVCQQTQTHIIFLTHLLFRVENAMLLEDLAHNGHSRVDRVRNDEDKGSRAVFRHALCQITHNACVDLQVFKVIDTVVIKRCKYGI